jgi:hypothetical protein
MQVTKRIDLDLLGRELAAAGTPVPNGLALSGTLPGETSQELFTLDEHGQPADLPPEAVPVVDAHDASKPQRTTAFEQHEDAERLRIINERARTDPAYAALADLALRERP